MNYYTDKCDKILITSTIANTMHVLNFVFDLKYVTKFFFVKKILGDLFAEKETKRRPILAKGLLRRPRSPKGDLFGNTGIERSF